MTSRDRSAGSATLGIGPAPSREPTHLVRESGIGTAHYGHNGRPSSPPAPISSETRPDSRKRPSTSTDTGDEGRTKEARRTGKNKEKTAQRAAQACLRCRRQKLRCLGGNPCERCIRTSNVCDFGQTAPRAASESREASSNLESVAAPTITTAPAAANDRGRAERLQQLEISVADLLAGLAEEPDLSGQGFPHLEIFHEVIKHRKEPSKTTPTSQPNTTPRLPPPTHSRALDPIRLGSVSGNPVISPSSTYQGQNSTPRGIISDSSPADTTSEHPVPLEAVLDRRSTTTGDGEKGVPIPAAESLYEAPFRSLVHQSRRGSPEREPYSRGEPERFDYKMATHRDDDDPVNTGIVDQEMAMILFQFFIDHCHSFLPIIDVAPRAAFSTTRQSPPLFSAMIAIAARFYTRYNARHALSGGSTEPPLEPSVPTRLANLAEAHLSHTLLRRRYALTDVQAILLLAAWNLRAGSHVGPDAWVVTGHAARVSRRLGVHKILAQAAEIARSNEQGSPEWQKLEACLPQWRTWLCWFTFDGFLSLGFGRPQSTQFETVDEYGFLQMRLNGPLPRPGSVASHALCGDVYIAGQVQLAQIGRDLINWGEMLADPEKAIYADPRRAEIFRNTELSVKTMFVDLNARLDEWCRTWVWTGSPYAPYLGSSARVARLQAEHLRLCLNSYVLKVGTEEDEYSVQCLRNAFNAAVSTIQTHHESSQTDFGLSFATDYLTITFAQAAVFLVRITQASQTIQAALKVEKPVILHYVQMSIDLLESSDMSETGLGTNLAKTLREHGRAASVSGVPTDDVQETIPIESEQEQQPNPINTTTTPAPTFDFSVPTIPTNYQDIFHPQNELDLNYLLGLTSTDGGSLQNGGNWSFNNPDNMASYSDLGFAMGGMGDDNANQSWNGTIDGLETVFGFGESNQGTH